MNIVRNEALISRNARIGQVTMIVSLVTLAGGMYISFSNPSLFGISLAALMLGFLLSQVGIYFSEKSVTNHNARIFTTFIADSIE